MISLWPPPTIHRAIFLCFTTAVCLRASQAAGLHAQELDAPYTPPQWERREQYSLIDAVFTPWHGDGSLDLSPIPAYAELVAAMQTSDVFVAGTSGEWPNLTADERLALFGAWRAALDALPGTGVTRPRLIAHVGSASVFEAKNLAAGAAAAGADAIAFCSPLVNQPDSVATLVDGIARIASAAPRLPAFYCMACRSLNPGLIADWWARQHARRAACVGADHNPTIYGVDFDIEAVLRAAIGHVPSLVGVMYTDTDLLELARASSVQLQGSRGNGTFALFHSGAVLADFASGASGTVTHTTETPWVARLRASYAGGHDDAAATQAWLLRCRALLASHIKLGEVSLYGVHRALTKALGVDIGPPRFPLHGLPDERLRVLVSELEAEGCF